MSEHYKVHTSRYPDETCPWCGKKGRGKGQRVMAVTVDKGRRCLDCNAEYVPPQPKALGWVATPVLGVAIWFNTAWLLNGKVEMPLLIALVYITSIIALIPAIRMALGHFSEYRILEEGRASHKKE